MAAVASKRSGIVLAATGLFLVATLLAPAAFSLAPSDPTSVAVVFPPWRDHEADFLSVIAAGGRILREGALPNILIAKGEDGRFGTRLYAEGAWAVVDPLALGGCLLGHGSAT